MTVRGLNVYIGLVVVCMLSAVLMMLCPPEAISMEFGVLRTVGIVCEAAPLACGF